MHKIAKAIIIVGAAMLTVSCAPAAQTAPPELLTPVSVKADTARVDRGNVERMEQYKGFVRVASEKLYFPETGLRFGEYYCVPGQAVKQGDLLARLDTESVDKQIESQLESMARTRQEQAFEIEGYELDIAIAQCEWMALTKKAAGYEEEAMKAAESKKIDIERKQLALSQVREQQALTMRYAEEQLAALYAKIENAEMRAPIDGLITYMADKAPGAEVEAFAPLIYISDEQEMFVEYSSLVSLSISKNSIVKGYVGDRVYDLERIPVTRQDQMYYSVLRLTPPLRFSVIDADELIRPGAYVAIRVYTEYAEDVLRIPANALFSDADIGYYVYLMENGQKVLHPIEPGLRATSYVEIKSGLQEGDEVFVKQ